jgi:uncharacterized membrane-anchored protein
MTFDNLFQAIGAFALFLLALWMADGAIDRATPGYFRLIMAVLTVIMLWAAVYGFGRAVMLW